MSPSFSRSRPYTQTLPPLFTGAADLRRGDGSDGAGASIAVSQPGLPRRPIPQWAVIASGHGTIKIGGHEACKITAMTALVDGPADGTVV
jgi:hypothetical protein